VGEGNLASLDNELEFKSPASSSGEAKIATQA